MYTFDDKWLEKLAAMRAAGKQPYPNAEGLAPTHTSADLRAACEGKDNPADAVPGDVTVAGRVMFRNDMGKAMFLRVQDRGGIIQVYARKNELGDDVFAMLKDLDIGDFISVTGFVMKTKTGELSVQAKVAKFGAKNLSPFPDRFHTLSDVELRSRQRYVDLFMNEDSRATFTKRAAIVKYVRDFFHARNFVEVETPMMQTIPGGATARPFITHHNALDIDLYLRVAPELFLKRLIVGGMERVFEINRNFRNEGLSHKHNPEFTMLEFYWAWATYKDLIDLSETLLSGLCVHITGGSTIQFNDMTIDFSAPFKKADMDLLISEATGLSRADLRNPEKCRAFWMEKNPDDAAAGKDGLYGLPTTFGRWWEKLFETYVEPTLVNPTFVTGFPAEISPLARRTDDDPDRTDRFELYVARWELANAFTELNDPVDQAERFAAQARAKDAGDAEAMFFDADYVRALAYGMPPTAGQGIGIDRLVMLLTGRTSIREVILFPTHRPEAV